MKKNIVILIAAIVLCCSCSDLVKSQAPPELNRAKRPITIMAINDQGVMLVDGDGILYSYDEEYYFVQPLLKAGYKKGDQLVVEGKTR